MTIVQTKCVIFCLKILIKTLKLNFYGITYVNFELFLISEDNFENVYSPYNEHI